MIVVIGFYTPDYRHLADRLATDCHKHAIHNQFYSLSAREWSRAILAKPTTLQRARRDYPDATLVLMDVDCRLHGTLAPLEAIAGDIGLHQRCKLGSKKRRSTIWPSSRLVVVRPTQAADDLIALWADACEESADARGAHDDEIMLAYALSRSDGVAVSMLPAAYAAFEDGEAPTGAVVVHHSQHDAARKRVTFWRAVKMLRRRAVAWWTGVDYQARKYSITQAGR